ncbi:MAG: glycosyltransferase family 4 protein [Thermodesulfobacteriota bacterium]|nr:glycosyltransferase family 4 protein [Thermodesulfobacteriota bacterium]
MDKKSICIVTEEKIPPVYRFSLSFKLAEHLSSNTEVHLVSLTDQGAYSLTGIEFHPVCVKNWSLFSLKKRFIANVKLLYKVCYVCCKYKIDLLYGWWPVVFIASFLCRKPFCGDMPEFIEEMYRSFDRPFKKIMGSILKYFQIIAAKKSRAIIVETEKAKDRWMKRNILEEKIFSFPYGVEVDKFSNPFSDDEKVNLRKEYNIPEEAFLVMYHGDIGFDDGVDILINTVNELNETIWLICIGDGPPEYMEKLKFLASKKIVFTGWKEYKEIPKLFAMSDIYVAPFRSTTYTNTTFPLKQMEAMAAGKPVICTKIEAFSKAVNDGEDIILAKPEDKEELKEKILYLLKNREKMTFLGNNAKKTAIEKFNWIIRVKKEQELIFKTFTWNF